MYPNAAAEFSRLRVRNLARILETLPSGDPIAVENLGLRGSRQLRVLACESHEEFLGRGQKESPAAQLELPVHRVEEKRDDFYLRRRRAIGPIDTLMNDYYHTVAMKNKYVSTYLCNNKSKLKFALKNLRI